MWGKIAENKLDISEKCAGKQRKLWGKQRKISRTLAENVREYCGKCVDHWWVQFRAVSSTILKNFVCWLHGTTILCLRLLAVASAATTAATTQFETRCARAPFVWLSRHGECARARGNLSTDCACSPSARVMSTEIVFLQRMLLHSLDYIYTVPLLKAS